MRQNNGPLFDGAARARSADPTTSKTAAASLNKDGKAKELAQRVLGVLRSRAHGGTSGEIADTLGIGRDSVSPRMKKLEDANLVVRTTERRERQTVWKAALVTGGTGDVRYPQ